MRKKKLVKLLSAVFVLAALITNNLCVYAEEQVTAGNSDYQVYDMSTGEITYHLFKDLPEPEDGEGSPGYFPNDCLEEMDNIEISSSINGIVGTDNRYKITNTTTGPYCNTVYISSTYSNGATYTGSGFVIGPSAVATAAHCVYKEDWGYATSVKVVPAKNGSTEPYGSNTVSVNNLVVSSDYITNNNNNAYHDWAIIELSTNLGDSTGWLGLKWQSSSYNNTSVYNTGYPATVNGQSDGTHMYCGTGLVKSSENYILKGNWDASAGNSGGPVFAYYSDLGYTAIGILTSGSSSSLDGSQYPTSYSTATRITQDMYNLFVSYR